MSLTKPWAPKPNATLKIPVVDEQQIFQGIVTRREFMKSFNFLTHEIGKQYDMIEKDFSTSEKAK